MTKERLQAFKRITTLSGVVVTFSGIILSVATGGSWWSGSLSFFGLLLTCSGHWISAALDRHKAAERAADEERFSEMESMSELLNEAGVFDRPASLKRMIREHEMRYDEEHQDDGR